MSRWSEYLKYHTESAKIGDIDPSYAMLRYVADRFELSVEQRYWIAWIYAMTYCGASTFYIYNEFPDYENVDVGRLQRWWASRGRAQVICQTDRRWVRSSNQFVPAFMSYRNWVQSSQLGTTKLTQGEHFAQFMTPNTPEQRYDKLYKSATQLFSMGQFALFLYLEALHTITPLDLMPTDLDLDKAWSCRNGLYYACDMDEFITEKEGPTPAAAKERTWTNWSTLKLVLSQLENPPTIWQTETILCAYRKYYRGKRYIGYYLDRQAGEIAKMADHVKDGVCWDVLWQYRKETYNPDFIAESRMTPRDIAENRRPFQQWKEEQVAYTQKVIA